MTKLKLFAALAVTVLTLAGGYAAAQLPNSNYTVQGGLETVIGGDIDLNGTVDTTDLAFGTDLDSNPLAFFNRLSRTSAQLVATASYLSGESGRAIYCDMSNWTLQSDVTPTGPGTDVIVIEEAATGDDLMTVAVGALAANTPVTAHVSGVSATDDCLAGLASGDGIKWRLSAGNGSGSASLAGSYGAMNVVMSGVYTWQ